MPADIVTTQQLADQRAFIDNINNLAVSWWKRLPWYPRMQECLYRRIDQIYLESRQMYGDEHFLRYATRQRLAKKHTLTAADVEEELATRRTIESDCCLYLSVPKTTNGEYGRLKPTSLHWC